MTDRVDDLIGDIAEALDLVFKGENVQSSAKEKEIYKGIRALAAERDKALEALKQYSNRVGDVSYEKEMDKRRLEAENERLRARIKTLEYQTSRSRIQEPPVRKEGE